jgi:hypothetical protein
MRTLPLIAVLAAVACEPSLCKSSDNSSVTVSVYDSDGDAQAPDEVEYAVDGAQREACESLGGDGSEFICGYEESGSIEVFVSHGGTEYTETVEVGMDLDGCHVKSEFLEFTLD